MKLKQVLDGIDLSNIDAFYCDIRLEEMNSTTLRSRNFEFDFFEQTPSLGAFLRVYNNGKWFYKSTTDLETIEAQFKQLASDSKKFNGENIDLFSTVPTEHDELIRFNDHDPRNISLEHKKDLCGSYSDCFKSSPLIKEHSIMYTDTYHLKGFKSSRGRSYLYDYVQYGMAFRWVLKDGENLFSDYLNEWEMTFDNCKNFRNIVDERIKSSLPHLEAKPIDPGKYTVVMNSEVVGVFAHESFGHKSEADAMLGDKEAMDEWKIGTKVASDIVNIIDEGTQTGNSGYVPFDDEGMPAQTNYLIKDGKLAGRLHSLHTANTFDEKPTSNARAMSFEYEPIVRMTNTYVEAGTQSFDEMISSIKDGIYVDKFSHGSGLSTFTIAPVRSYRIKDGKIAEPVRVAVISGTVFETLKNITALSDGLEIKSSAFGGCGKGEQWPLRVGDGGPSMVVKGMQVG